MGLFEMALETAPGAFGDFMLDKGGEEPGRGPAFFVGTGGDFRPDGFMAGNLRSPSLSVTRPLSIGSEAFPAPGTEVVSVIVKVLPPWRAARGRCPGPHRRRAA